MIKANLFHPERFQGSLKKKKYFEGWYFKQVSPDNKHVMAFIPGISLSDDPHAFIQVINGTSHVTRYFRFPVNDFVPARRKFEIRLGDNFFSREGLRLHLPDGENSIRADLRFVQPTPYPVQLLSPGIMGWYAYMPFMECYHGVVSSNHFLEGSIAIGARETNFNGGKGYIEKDWGTSFPESYIWLQANAFSEQDTSLLFSLARIPWLGKSFPGFLCFLHTGGKYYRFMTYTGAGIHHLSLDGNRFSAVLSGSGYRLEINARHGDAGDLHAPESGNMSRIIRESVDSEAEITLLGPKETIAAGSSACAGFEISGNVDALISDLTVK